MIKLKKVKDENGDYVKGLYIYEPLKAYVEYHPGAEEWELALGEASVYDRTKGGVVSFLGEIVKKVEEAEGK